MADDKAHPVTPASTKVSDTPSQSPLPGQPVRRHFLSLSRFDKTVAVMMSILVGLVGLTILLGDRVGVTLERMGPLGMARSTASIVMQFSEAMNRDSVPARLRLVQIPADKTGTNFHENDVLAEMNGTVSWNASTLTFRPVSALKPGATYQVMLSAGATSDSGRKVLSEYRYSFTVRSPRVAYLAPADSAPFDIWIADPTDPKSAKRLTNSVSGIYDYSVSPDGTQIAFSEQNSSTGTIDIKLVDLDTGAIQQITNCPDAECKTPVWRPDGQMIAYERVDYNSDLSAVGKPSPTRIWVIDLTSKAYTTRPMFTDSQRLGYGLEWSADGQRVSLFDANSQAIEVYDFRDNSTVQIPNDRGNTGELSPDGLQIVFPNVVLTATDSHSYLQLADLKTDTIKSLSTPTDPVDDDGVRWSPDGSYLVIGRRYTDEQRFTRGKQLFRLNPADGSVEPLVNDPTYNNGFFSFDPTGSQLVIDRYPDPVALNDPTNLGLPEIWTLDVSTKTLTKVSGNAFLGRWVP